MAFDFLALGTTAVSLFYQNVIGQYIFSTDLQEKLQCTILKNLYRWNKKKKRESRNSTHAKKYIVFFILFRKKVRLVCICYIYQFEHLERHTYKWFRLSTKQIKEIPYKNSKTYSTIGIVLSFNKFIFFYLHIV